MDFALGIGRREGLQYVMNLDWKKTYSLVENGGDTHEVDDKILYVPINDPRYATYKSMTDIGEHIP